MVTNSRKTLPSPISSRVGSPAYFRSWGGAPIEQWLSKRLREPTVVPLPKRQNGPT